MRLLLTKAVDKLGEPGDEVDVRPGYARNYLLPRGFGVPTTDRNREEVAELRKEWAVQKAQDLAAAKALAEALEGQSLRFERRVKTNSMDLYGSVSVLDIARQLEQDGFAIERRRIILGGPIRSAGTAEVGIRLHQDVRVQLPIEITAVGAEALADAPGILVPPEPAPAAEDSEAPDAVPPGSSDAAAAD